ncbi:MAG: RnfABCDGE type electron transport complex subunit D [Lachnospiraceae bacterium]|nr:RnfABCDGE type electron transport complex subunit D [Lachnospiraceae bacterium]MBR6485092.1 RnfABCDGE type electron transport complex subunit D [Lachnospiraceae bacterium]
MNELLNVSSGPHVRSKYSTDKIMGLVLLSLMPAAGYGIYHFGVNAAILIVVSVLTCVLTELIYELVMKQDITISDLSAAVTGLLLALNMPPTAAWWLPVIGGVFAIVFVKMLFGGLGQNFMNPALAGRCFLVICFAARMTDFNYDGMTSATPLMMIRTGSSVNVRDMVFGNIAGTVGETSVIAIVAGACIMLAFGIIDLKVPASYIITFVIFMGLFAGRGWDVNYLTAQLAGGGLMLGAFFMATDYATCPITDRGKIFYGICLGLMTGIFRCFSSSAEGVSFAIVFCNLLVPLIEKLTLPKCFGKGGEV